MTKALKVILPTPEYVTEAGSRDGGLATYLGAVAPALRAAGCEPVVVVAARRNGEIEHEGVRVRRVDCASRWVSLLDRLSGRRHWPALRWGWQGRCLARVVEAERRTAVGEVVVQYPNYTAPARYCRVRRGAVMRLSSFQPLWARHHRNAETRLLAQIDRMEREGMEKVGAIFAPSRLIADVVGRETGRAVTVLPGPFVPWVTSGGGETKTRPWEGERYLLFFGSLSPLKGIEEIAGALEGWLEANRGWHFVLAGRDLGETEPWWPKVRAAAGREAGRVHYPGRLGREELGPLISRADGVVLPSRVDNLPNAVMEAMGAGRVVVGTRGSSIDELITDGIDGVLCEAGDATALRAAMDRVAGWSEVERREMGERARQAMERLSPGRTVGPLTEYYRRILREGAA